MAEKNVHSKISLTAAICIGIGGMIGAGIFSILGIVAEAAGHAMWISFLLGGIVALFTTYSYAKLAVRFPSQGGAVQFLVEGWGKGIISGSLNIFMWLGYIISIALYAQGFAAYFMTFFPAMHSPLYVKITAVSVVLLFALLNILGARLVGQAETVLVFIKVFILLFFAVVGLLFGTAKSLNTAELSNVAHIFFGAGVLFIGYEGFGLVTNTVADMDNPEKNIARALYLSVIIVIAIYLAVSLAVLASLSLEQIASSRDDALAYAAQPILGEFGFRLVAIAALLSTASAINATLFGAANVSYTIAKDQQLPPFFNRKTWAHAPEGLVITTMLIVAFIIFFDLSGIAMMGSGAFLLIYAAVNAGHLRILKKTGGRFLMVLIALILCLAMFIFLEIYTYMNSKEALFTMIGLLVFSCIAEIIYRKYSPHHRR